MRPNRPRCVSLTVCALLMIAACRSWSVAQLMTYVSQVRTVRALASHDSTLVTASDFSPFSRLASASGGFGNLGRATQQSTLNPLALSLFSDVAARGGNQLTGANAASTFDITFQVLEPVPFRLAGSWRHGLGGYGDPQTLVRLSYQGSTLYQSLGDRDAWSDQFDWTGDLVPGTYRFVASNSAAAGGFSGHASTRLDVTLYLPSPGTAPLLLAALWRRSRRPVRG